MMHITEDTPPDMLAGAMDLTVHLPNGRSVKMSVERCTPMMDVLMQITAAHHLQLSGYVIEALGMAPSSEHSDKVLPYKPNTPIGTLDTQHIRVVQKARTLPVPKTIAPGHQPFESTFRLKVHLPRKQLFVSRVSMNVLLEDIMLKVCDEKNLDPSKYEFRHPDNQNEVLDPKLTLEHYKITEIYVVSKGSSRLSQAFSASDIMALRKDEERKHSKSSGGVFNLIFKRGKMSNGSGSLSSDNRSISPTHSDDSRSVTPPAIQQQILKSSGEKPKAPQRKRRPAPKPPQPKEEPKQVEAPTENPKKNENGLTICHSRNSSDSSGYHEASILSDNANTSLPRRPQTMIISEDAGRNKLNGEHSKSTSNLASMSLQSKSTSSLAFAGRKKKAPPPPPVLKTASSVTNLEKASPVVASPVEQRDLPTAKSVRERLPVPVPRKLKVTEEAKDATSMRNIKLYEDAKINDFITKLEDDESGKMLNSDERVFRNFENDCEDSNKSVSMELEEVKTEDDEMKVEDEVIMHRTKDASYNIKAGGEVVKRKTGDEAEHKASMKKTEDRSYKSEAPKRKTKDGYQIEANNKVPLHESDDGSYKIEAEDNKAEDRSYKIEADEVIKLKTEDESYKIAEGKVPIDKTEDRSYKIEASKRKTKDDYKIGAKNQVPLLKSEDGSFKIVAENNKAEDRSYKIEAAKRKTEDGYNIEAKNKVPLHKSEGRNCKIEDNNIEGKNNVSYGLQAISSKDSIDGNADTLLKTPDETIYEESKNISHKESNQNQKKFSPQSAPTHAPDDGGFRPTEEGICEALLKMSRNNNKKRESNIGRTNEKAIYDELKNSAIFEKIKSSKPNEELSDDCVKINEEKAKKVKAGDGLRKPNKDFYEELKKVVSAKQVLRLEETDGSEEDIYKKGVVSAKQFLHLEESDEDFKRPEEDIYEELKKFTHEKNSLKQFLETEETTQNGNEDDIYEELKQFSHEKLQLKLSLETDEESSEGLGAVEAKNKNAKKVRELKNATTRPYELTQDLEMRKYEEEDFPVMVSTLGGNKHVSASKNDVSRSLQKKDVTEKHGLELTNEENRSEIYTDESVELEKEENGLIFSTGIYTDKSVEMKKEGKQGLILSSEIYTDESVDLEKEENGSIQSTGIYTDRSVESNKEEKQGLSEMCTDDSVDLKKEENVKHGLIMSTDEFVETEKLRLILPGEKSLDESADLEEEEQVHNRNKEAHVVLKQEETETRKKHAGEAEETPASIVFNSKDEMMKIERDAKYKRVKSFLQDSDEEIIEATADNTQDVKIVKSSKEDCEPNFIIDSRFGSNLKSKISLFEAKYNKSSQNNYMQALDNINVDLFNPKYRRNPMPLFPKTNDLEKPANAFDTFTRKRGFGIGRAMLDLEYDKADAISVSSSASNEYGDDEMSDVNVEMFAAPEAPMKTNSANAMDELMGMHSFKPKDILKKRHSAASLRDAGNIPGFSSIKKWSNTEKLDGAGLDGSKWVVGDSDSEPTVPKHSEDPITAGQQFTTNSPPESIASSLATTLSSNIETDINLSKENSEIVENEPEEKTAEVTPPENTFLPIQNNDAVDEPEWQYRLPSPPTAFRDSSPTLVENLTVYESTEQFKSDSVVTSPELFEKLKLVKETQSVTSEEEKPIFNKLSLENLEKRKSLVYNRELATSLKYKDDDDSQKSESISSKRSSVMSELEEVISNSKSSTLNKNAKSDNFIHSDSNLPNFKITTYDMPKKKINIFEDDSIRSNENSCKFNAVENISSLLKKSYVGRSMENLALKKPTDSSGNRYKAKTLARNNAEATVGRSESFNAGNWVPSNPVKRSKSQVAINQYKEEMNGTSGDGSLSKSNSLFDVSGLQSLEVMRLIQTKLKTPSNSTDELDRKEPEKPVPTEVPENTQPEQHQQHRYGPPSINLGTWSERPKSQITLKEDTDYKFNTSNTKLIASTHKIPPEEPTLNIRVNGMQPNLSIKVNGRESITPQPSGNVIIKIGGNEKARFNHTTAVGFRRPLGNVNTLEKQRPHSVAFDSNFDISRVPIVRSVELKKHFKDMHINKSITQICPQDEVESKSLSYSVNAKTNPIMRINSFSQNNQSDYTTNKNVPFSQVKLRRTDSNKNVQVVNNNNNNNIFGKVVLRNTSNRFSTGNVVEKPPPPPMMMPFVQSNKHQQNSTDPRDELLSAIRNFGGKRGLKSVKV